MKDIFIKKGKIRSIGGNQPLLLNRKTHVYYIISGFAEVFSTEIKNNHASGKREHLFTAEEGDLLFGMNLYDYKSNRGLVVIGNIDTRVVVITISNLKKLINAEHYKIDICNLIDNWIYNLSQGLSKTIVSRPKADIFIEKDNNYLILNGETVKTKKRITWLVCEEGNAVYLGMEDLSDPETTPFPLALHSWIQTTTPSKIAAYDTQLLIQNCNFWKFMDSFYKTFFLCDFWNFNLLMVDELNQLKERIKLDRNSNDMAFLKLASIVDEQKLPKFDSDIDDPVYISCKIIAEHLDLELHHLSELDKKRRDEPADTTKKSNIRTRMVFLNQNWWKHDSGPLLAFLKENSRPVAIIPVKQGVYEIHDPVEKKSYILTEDNAHQIQHFGYSFYRNFKPYPLSKRDVLSFSLKKTSTDFIRILFTGITGSILGLVPPVAVVLLFNSIIPTAEHLQFIQVSIALIFSSIFTAVFSIVRNISMLRVIEKMDFDIQSALWDRILNLPASFFRKYLVGDLAARALGIHFFRQTLSDSVISSILTGFFSFSNIILLYVLDVKLAVIATFFILLYLIFNFISCLFFLKYQKEFLNVSGYLSGQITQFITGINKLKVAGAERRAFTAWSKIFGEQKLVTNKINRLSNFIKDFSFSFQTVSLILILAIAILMKNGNIMTGTFIGFYIALGSVFSALTDMMSGLTAVIKIIPVFERTEPILKNIPESQTSKTDIDDITGEIEINHLFFRYKSDSPVILNDLTLNIQPGKFYAIAGPSGSGKSTILRLLLGFESPESGSVYYDGQNLSRINIQSLRRQIGVVLQNSKLLPGNIYTNIAGASNISLEEAYTAANEAGFSEDIDQLPMGMDTIVSEGGDNFSGGQKQRLLIARALASRPRLLLLDEATSALDNMNQAIIKESIDKLQITRIVIAHRLSTIKDADCIFVIDKGRVVQTGQYNDLINEPGIFADLAKRQLVVKPYKSSIV
ncbi:MAG: NHLP bacteriocin export ABC transporter permease/ATPase subunit [bacterium]|nr:NHLP bacteriocin export ABC transporter permease/ATPase subunit [bacterium]